MFISVHVLVMTTTRKNVRNAITTFAGVLTGEVC